MSQKHIAILTLENDIHGNAIQKAFDSYDDIVCHIIETDKICGREELNWSSTNDPTLNSTLPTKDGNSVNVSSLDVIWWRRTTFPQKFPDKITDSIHIELINNDCSAALFGLISTSFSGVWINNLTAIIAADNKLIQLKTAQQAGFKIPQTLVSQNPTKIREFYHKLKNKVVVKPVKGTNKAALLTTLLSEEHLVSDEALRLCPAIYQEYIPGIRHIRAHCFGDSIYAVLIKSDQLDWRQNLDIPFTIFNLDNSVEVRLHSVLKELGLKMGVVDLKLTENSEVVWFEVNQQGQFLFSEGLSDFDLTSVFIEFLYKEACRVHGG